MRTTANRLYLIPVLSKGLDVLELLQREAGPLSLEEIYRRTRFSKTTVYRVLKTLVHRGYIAQTADGLYRNAAKPSKLRFGYAGQSGELPFSNQVTHSLQIAAASAGVELVVLDNKYDAHTAVENARALIEQRVDVLIELQVEQSAAATIGHLVSEARIPFIAVDIPHPNSTYFGVDNYRVGMEAGSLLAEHVRRKWKGKIDWMLGLDLPEAGVLVQGRVSGAVESLRSALGGLPAARFVRVDGRGLRDHSRQVVLKFLRSHPDARRIAIAAATDSSALGAVDAARELRRERDVAIVGQDFIPEAMQEMRRRGSPLIGTVSHEADSYGPALLALGLALVRGGTVAPYNYVQHRVVARVDANIS